MALIYETDLVKNAQDCDIMLNEAPGRKLWGIKAKLRRSPNPPSL